MTIPPVLIINAIESTKSDLKVSQTVELAAPLGLERLNIRYTTLPPNETLNFTTPPKCNQFVYLVLGAAELSFVGQSGPIKTNECFSFASGPESREYSITSGEEGSGILVFTDLEDQNRGVSVSACDRCIFPLTCHKPAPSPPFPTVISAPSVTIPYFTGIFLTDWASLTEQSDMASIAERPWNVNFERMPPGTQSSNPHAHSQEDEAVFILSGKARYWHHGEEKALRPGDCVGWRAGTGITHAIYNDGEGTNGEGIVFRCR